MIELAAGEWSARLRPEIGGSIAALERGGVPVLRTMPAAASLPLDAACFPMVPYANRIADGRFRSGERTVAIAPKLAGHRHPLHGLGWLASWRVVRSDATSALLEHTHDGSGEWPWAYIAHQHIALDASGCTVRLLARNDAVEPAPLGLGLHPYFRRVYDTTVTFAAEAMMGIDGEALADGTSLPADTLAPWHSGAALPDELVDHCFTGWENTATIADKQGTITIRGFGTPHCHVYAPPGGGPLCIEPVSHTPDALNRAPETMPIVQPGCAAGLAMRIEAVNA